MSNPNQPTILVVENDEHILHLLTLLLGRAGYRCITAVTGAQGISSFMREHPQLVITDLNMPGGDGITLIDAIHRQAPVSVIVITAFAADFQARVQKRSKVLVLPKPFDSKKLLRHVRELCSRSWEMQPVGMLIDNHNSLASAA